MTISQGIRRVLIPLLLLSAVGVAAAPLTTDVPPNAGSTSDFAAFMEPRLTALVVSSRNVETMVSDRSRNVLALRAESKRIDALVDDIDGYLVTHDVPPWAASLVTRYREGVTRIQTAIDAAYDALSRFDFSKMPEMIPVFSRGTDDLEGALRVLRDAAGSGSSYTGNGVA